MGTRSGACHQIGVPVRLLPTSRCIENSHPFFFCAFFEFVEISDVLGVGYSVNVRIDSCPLGEELSSNTRTKTEASKDDLPPLWLYLSLLVSIGFDLPPAEFAGFVKLPVDNVRVHFGKHKWHIVWQTNFASFDCLKGGRSHLVHVAHVARFLRRGIDHLPATVTRRQVWSAIEIGFSLT